MGIQQRQWWSPACQLAWAGWCLANVLIYVEETVPTIWGWLSLLHWLVIKGPPQACPRASPIEAGLLLRVSTQVIFESCQDRSKTELRQWIWRQKDFYSNCLWIQRGKRSHIADLYSSQCQPTLVCWVVRLTDQGRNLSLTKTGTEEC